MFKLSEFRSEVESRGVMRTNTFLVNFAPPKVLRNDRTPNDRITLRCESVQLPGMGFATTDGPPTLGYGPIESMPYSVAFEDITCTFLVDARGDMHKFFYNWMNRIVNFRAKGQSELDTVTNGLAPYEVNYKDNYSTTINIEVYDVSTGTKNDPSARSNSVGQKVLTARAHKAFPKLLPSLDMSWGSNDELVKLSIPFNYTDFDVEYHNKPNL